MTKKYENVKVKTFLKKTRKDAMMHFGLSSKEYDQVLSFIKESNLAKDQMLHLYPSPTGELCIGLSNNGVADGGDAGQKTPQAPKKDEPKQAAKQAQGSYVFTTMQPGGTPYIQSGTYNPRLADAMSIVSVLCGVAYLTWQVCLIVFGIQDRKAGRTNQGDNASNTLNN